MCFELDTNLVILALNRIHIRVISDNQNFQVSFAIISPDFRHNATPPNAICARKGLSLQYHYPETENANPCLLSQIRLV
jgi:hypothetical protein